MELFFISFVVLALAVLGMALGVILRGRAIKGSCGGLNAIDGLEGSCEICSGDGRCRRKRKRLVR